MSRPHRTVRRRRGLLDPTSPSAEPFRTLRLALQLRTEERRGRCLVFTSAEPAAGKSTVAANYALLVAVGQSRVALVDADLRRPVLHELFAVPRSPGLVDAVANPRLDVDLIVHRPTEEAHLAVLTAGSPFSRPSDLMSSRATTEILARLAASYDAVVVDAPPVLATSDAESIAANPAVDVVLVTTMSTRRRWLAKALRRLELVDANVCGIVVNREGSFAPYAYYAA